MKIFVLISFIISSIITNAQTSDKCQHSCKYLYRSISYFWKLDSLGTNGFRYEVYKCLIKCFNDTLNIEFVLENLGKPNEIGSNSYSDYVIYYYYNGRLLPKEAGYTREFLSIIINFDPKSKKILSISDQFYD